MIIKTMSGRLYKLVGVWDSSMVFSSVDREDYEVMIYTKKELRSLIRIGRLVLAESPEQRGMFS